MTSGERAVPGLCCVSPCNQPSPSFATRLFTIVAALNELRSTTPLCEDLLANSTRSRKSYDVDRRKCPALHLECHLVRPVIHSQIDCTPWVSILLSGLGINTCTSVNHWRNLISASARVFVFASSSSQSLSSLSLALSKYDKRSRRHHRSHSYIPTFASACHRGRV